ncbi:MAG: hypothetical protein V7K90_16415 [Nostoc sp.]|uniref:hypothetical protein n=1 Tax=Nostoc sp. TaxID=1180 RepID=UPI002FFC99E9
MASRYRGESAFTLALRGLDFIGLSYVLQILPLDISMVVSVLTFVHSDVTNMTIKFSRFLPVRVDLPWG